MNKRINKKGFSLSELLTVVAILIILFGIIAINVINYRRSLVQVELDNTAKEIFVSAQNHLSMAKGVNYLGRSKGGVEEKDAEDKGTGIYYYVVDKNKLDDPDDNNILNLMVPFGGIDESVRTSNSYIIRYNKDQAIIMDVFYTETSGWYKHDFSFEEYSSLMKNYRGDENKDKRKNYNGSVIGYYGGAIGESKTNVYKAPELRVFNDDKLSLKVTHNNTSVADEYKTNLKVILTGETSKVKKEIYLIKSGVLIGNDSVSYDLLNNEFTVILDDITTEGLGFSNQFATGEQKLIPGENISIEAIVFSNTKLANIASSAVKKTNSLYASYDGTKTVEISSFRHLENLDKDISNVDLEKIVLEVAEQTTDLVWNSGEVFKNSSKIYGYKTDGSVEQLSTSYAPVDIDNLKYNGNRHSISDVYINTSGNGGLFGNVTNISSINDLELIDFNIKANGKAGALVGVLDASKVSGVLAHNDNSKIDTAYEINGKSSTGGLIGEATNNSSIDVSAAAVYVKSSNGDAGGLLGSLVSSTLSNSYSGGHTLNARYIESLTGQGRFNVIGYGNVGGLVGRTSGSSIAYAYTTSSVYGSENSSHVAGFIGSASNTTVLKSYCTGLTEKINNGVTANFVDDRTNLTVNSTSYYLNGISPNTRTETIPNVEGVSGKDSTATYFILPEGSRGSAFVYDDALVTEYLGKFYFPNIEQLSGTTIYTGITNRHYGDWQIPSLDLLDFYIVNNDRLTLNIVLKDASELTFTISGESSAYTKAYKLTINGNTVKVDAEGHVENNVFVWDDAVTSSLPMVVQDGVLVVTLDDITEKNQHFKELLPDFIPGENIRVRVAKDEVTWVDISSVEGIVENSLFALSDAGLTSANLRYVRHIQNLDPVISKVDSRITKAILKANISFDSAFYDKIYKYDGSANVDCFYGLYNPYLTEFDGGNYTLSNFPIYSAPDFIEAGTGNAGFFRLVDNGLNLHNLRFNDFVVTATNGYAGTAIAEIKENGATLNTLLASSNDKKVSSSGTAPTYYGAGGLVGLIDTKADITTTISNSSASMLVISDGYAGGLIANHNNGKLLIDSSYVGGHTDSKELKKVEYNTSGAAKYNVYATGTKEAGGLVARIGSNFEIKKSFSAASVACANTSYAAGGMVGKVECSGALDTVYVVAPVYNVKKGEDVPTTAAGAFIGEIVSGVEINNRESYCLAEIYPGESVSSEGVSSVSFLGNKTQGTLKENIKRLSFFADTKGNVISAKIDEEGMQARTFPYDDALKPIGRESSKEFPFSIWTKFGFERNDHNLESSYYGDWQSTVKQPVVGHKVTFYYVDPTSSDSTPIRVEDIELGEQTISEGKANEVLIPSSQPKFNKYIISYWEVDGDSTHTKFYGKGANITIPSNYCDQDVKLIAYYKLDTDKCYVSFYYDKDGNNTNFEQIGEAKKVETGTPLDTIIPPSRSIDDHKFVAWYSNPEFTEGSEIDFTDEAVAVTSNIDAYAKYERIENYVVTIDFMYSIDGEEVEHLNSVPRFRIEDLGQFKLKFEEGKTSSGSFDLPNVTSITGQYTITTGEYNEAGRVVSSDQILINNDKVDIVNVSSPKRFVVTYNVTSGINPDEVFEYKIFWVKHHTGETTTYKQGTTNDHKYGLVNGEYVELTKKNNKWYISGEWKNDVYFKRSSGTNGTYFYINDSKLIQIYPYNSSTNPRWCTNPDWPGWTRVYPNTVYQLVTNSVAGSAPYYGWDNVNKELVELTKSGDKFIANIEYTGTRYKQVTETGFVNNYDSVEVVDVYGKYFKAPKGTIPDLNFNLDLEGFVCEDHEFDDVKVETVVEGKKYNYYIDFDRKQYVLTYLPKSGTYVEPATIFYGENLISYKPGDVQRKYYKLDETRGANGWIIYPYGVDEPAVTQYYWTDNMPSSNLKAYPVWLSNETVYNIIFWKQSINDDYNLNINNDNAHKSYDFYKKETITGVKAGTRPNVDSYKTTSDVGFYYSWTDADNKTVAADGTTVVNVYYDRTLVYYHFWNESGKRTEYEFESIVESDDVEANYGLVDGEYIKLTLKNDKWYYTKEKTITEEVAWTKEDSIYNKVTSYNSEGTYYYINSDGSLAQAYRWRNRYYQWHWYTNKNHNTQIDNQVDTSKGIYISGSGNDNYGWDSNSKKLIPLIKKGNSYYYEVTTTQIEEIEYTGKRYINKSVKAPLKGLYGQQFSKYGYTWPIAKTWTIDDAPMTILTEFVYGLSSKNANVNRFDLDIFLNDSYKHWYYAYYYLENPDGTYGINGQPNDSGATTTDNYPTAFSITDKYNGYHYSKYQMDGSGNIYNIWDKTGSYSTDKVKMYNYITIWMDRLEYDLNYYESVEGLASESAVKTKKIKYLDNIYKWPENEVPEEPEGMEGSGYTWNGKYYKDVDCTEEFDFNITMPSNNIVIYLNYTLPIYTVSFDLNDPAPTIGTAADYISPLLPEDYILYIKQNNSVDSIISDENGNLRDEYTPIKEGYSFEGWYYTSQGVEKQFISSQNIVEDMEVYAKWSEEVSPTSDKKTVTFRYVCVNSEKEEIEIKPSTQKECEKGKYAVIIADDIGAYYPENTVSFFLVDETNNPQTFTLYYLTAEPWNYTVEYYARYSSKTSFDSDVTDAVLDDSADYLIKIDNKQAYYACEIVNSEMPAEYENYNIVGYEYNGATGKENTVSIDRSNPVVRFFIEPDITTVELNDTYKKYDGTNHAVMTGQIDSTNVFASPKNTTVTTYDLYRYSLDGEQIDKAIDVGNYDEKAYVYITVTGTARGEDRESTKTYLLWKSSGKDLGLSIGKRTVKLVSDTPEEFYYESEKTLVSDTFHIDSEYDDFVLGEGVDLKFSAESFRKNPGTTKNLFDYEFWKEDIEKGHKETKESNYIVLTEFGNLTVYWNYDISAYAQFESIKSETELSDILFADKANYLMYEDKNIKSYKFDSEVDYSFLNLPQFDNYLYDNYICGSDLGKELPATVYPYLLESGKYSSLLQLFLKPNVDLEPTSASVSVLVPEEENELKLYYLDPDDEDTPISINDTDSMQITCSIITGINNTVSVPELDSITKTVTVEPTEKDPSTTKDVYYKVAYWTVDDNEEKLVSINNELIIPASLCTSESLSLTAHYKEVKSLDDDPVVTDPFVVEDEGTTVLKYKSDVSITPPNSNTVIEVYDLYVPYEYLTETKTYRPLAKEKMYESGTYPMNAYVMIEVTEDGNTSRFLVSKSTDKSLTITFTK